jgi:hypothetical protein
MNGEGEILKARLEKKTYSLGIKKRFSNTKRFVILKKQKEDKLLADRMIALIKKISGKDEKI